MQDSEVSDGGEEEITTSQSSASMQVFAAVMVFSECSLNNRCHLCRILKLPYQALILLQICGSTTCPTAQCPRCQVGCSGSKNLPAVTTGG